MRLLLAGIVPESSLRLAALILIAIWIGPPLLCFGVAIAFALRQIGKPGLRLVPATFLAFFGLLWLIAPFLR